MAYRDRIFIKKLKEDWAKNPKAPELLDFYLHKQDLRYTLWLFLKKDKKIGYACIHFRSAKDLKNYFDPIDLVPSYEFLDRKEMIEYISDIPEKYDKLKPFYQFVWSHENYPGHENPFKQFLEDYHTGKL